MTVIKDHKIYKIDQLVVYQNPLLLHSLVTMLTANDWNAMMELSSPADQCRPVSPSRRVASVLETM